jgi:hypothetical protein
MRGSERGPPPGVASAVVTEFQDLGARAGAKWSGCLLGYWAAASLGNISLGVPAAPMR